MEGVAYNLCIWPPPPTSHVSPETCKWDPLSPSLSLSRSFPLGQFYLGVGAVIELPNKASHYYRKTSRGGDLTNFEPRQILLRGEIAALMSVPAVLVVRPICVYSVCACVCVCVCVCVQLKDLVWEGGLSAGQSSFVLGYKNGWVQFNPGKKKRFQKVANMIASSEGLDDEKLWRNLRSFKQLSFKKISLKYSASVKKLNN